MTWRRVLALLVALCLLWAGPAAAAITFLESGSNATYGMEFWDNLYGSVHDSSTAFAHTGTHSIRLLSGRAEKHGVLTNAGGRVSFYHVWGTGVPPADIIFAIITSDGTEVFQLQTNSSGVLQLRTQSGTQLGSDGATLAFGTWARISFAYVMTSSTVYEARVYVNGVLSITVSNGAALGASYTIDGFEIRSNNGDSYSYVSDIYADDSSALTDPGDIRVTAKLPVSNGSANVFGTQVGSGGSGYGTGHAPQVNERPLSETNGWEDTTAIGDQENYALEAAAVGDVDVSTSTIVGRSAWIWAKVSAASVLTKLMDNGTESAVTLTTSPALYTVITTSASYPSNAAGIGMRSSTTPNTFLYECGTLIAYTPGAAASGNKGSFLPFMP